MFDLHLGDCHDVLQALPDKCVDLVCWDVPYAITRSLHDQPLDWPLVWRELRRITKRNAAILLFAAQPFTTDLIISNRREFRYDLVWCKDRGGASGHLNARKMPLRRHETICVFYRSLPVYHPQWEDGEPNHSRGKGAAYAKQTVYGAHGMAPVDPEDRRKHPGSDLYFPAVPRSKRRHPQQKPWELCAYLIRMYSKPGAVVLDGSMGSRNTEEACLRTGRKFIGIERDPHYFEVARQHLEGLSTAVVAA